ncbi:MAG: glycosyltransferase family 4 protein [Candidatus Berkelbacteria bacterium]|nr:glycosyltransferase family 4 protein [Candidatus Berkelbacteria bacterium]
MEKPKIALLLNSFWVSGAGMSGGDQRLIKIFNRIGKNFQVDVWTSTDGKKSMASGLPSANFIVAPKKFDRFGIFPAYFWRSRWVKREIVKKNYDIIYCGSDFITEVLPATKYKSKNPSAIWVQCIFHLYPNWRKRPGNKIINFFAGVSQNRCLKLIQRRADKIVNINYQVREELIHKYHLEKNKIGVNPCGIDMKYFEKIKAKKNKNQACFLARLVPSKGIFDLPEIWREVVAKNSDAKLKIIGGGSQAIKDQLRKEFENLGLKKNIEILGFLPDEVAYKILKSSELFIFPSHEEGFGIAIAEAFAAGVPVVAWNLPVYAEVFAGAVVTAGIGERKNFAEKISSLLKNQKSLAKLASRGRSVVKKYSWQAIAAEEMKIISNAKLQMSNERIKSK